LHLTSLARLAGLLALALFTTGCASSVSIPSWQESVTKYVKDRGNGDPTVLRAMTLADNRAGFSVIGHHDADASIDANGLLLGHERVGERLWFVYLVGLVDKQVVKDIRLTAVSMDGGQAIWKRGRGSKASLWRYRDFGVKQAKERFPDRKTPPPRYTGFPRPDDVFKLTSDGGKLVATHEGSGARWELARSAQNR